MRKHKTKRPTGFSGYYVDVPEGGDAMRAYRKMKKWIKEDRFVERVKEKSTFRKPSEIKREKEKQKKIVLRKLRRERDDNRFMGRTKRGR